MQEAESQATTGASAPLVSPPAASGQGVADGLLGKLPAAGSDDTSGGEASGGDLDAGGDTPVDWEGIDAAGGEIDGDEGAPPAPPAASPPPAPKAAPKAPAPAAAPAPAPAPAAAPAAAAPAAPAAAPAQPPAAPAAPSPAAAQPAAPQPPAQPAETPEQRTAREEAERVAREKAEKETFDGLVKVYGLPDDAAAKLSTEPEQVLPWLAAKVHQNVEQSVIGAVSRLLGSQLPRMIQQANVSVQAEEKTKAAFYERWPQLNPEQHEQLVLKAGKLYREMNPSATFEAAREAIGRLVCDSLGIPVTGGVVTPPAGQPPAAQPPVHRPAGVGGSPAGAPPASDNVFTAMADEMLLHGDDD